MSKYLFLLAAMSIMSANSFAEVVFDGTTGSVASLPGPDFIIEADYGVQTGANLFHSFTSFNLDYGELATFLGTDTVKNIISRVTGGKGSHIDGVLKSPIADADLYFINPSGIWFGPNARLDIQGSFHASTADYLRLGEMGRFDAVNPESSILTVGTPSAFGFLSEPSAGIVKKGSFLAVPTGKTLSFTGNGILMDDNGTGMRDKPLLSAPDGHIDLVSVAARGEIPVAVPEMMEENAMARFGAVTITDAPATKENRLRKANLDVSGAGRGRIYIRGGNIMLENTYIFADTIAENPGNKTDRDGIILRAANELLANASAITTDVTTATDGGNIMVTAGRIELGGGSLIASTTKNAGDAGDINVNAVTEVKLAGFSSVVYDVDFWSGLKSVSKRSGNGGTISVNVPDLILTDGGRISTDTSSTGDAGDVSLEVTRLTVEKGGQISVNSSGAGQGGNLEVTAKEAVTVTGWWPIRDSSLTANARSLGAGGNIEISAPLIVIRDKGGTIQAGSDDAGEAGQIYLRNVDDALQVLDASILTSTEGADGGNIEISGSGYLYINNGEISTSVRARDGNGGNIRLKPGFIVLDKGKIKADASKGNGGDVMINATGIYKFSKEPLTGGADEKNAAISAHSELGINGEIRINSPDTDISGDLIVPPADFLKKEDVSIQQCEQRSVRESSRFAIGPLKDLPVPPDDLNAVEP